MWFWLALLIYFLSVAQIAAGIAKAYSQRYPVDLAVYRSALVAVSHRENPYEQKKGDIPFNYPPSTITLLYPANFVPKSLLSASAVITSICLLTASIFIVLKSLNVKTTSAENIILCALFLQTFAVKFTLVLGQLNIVVLFLALVSIYYEKKNDVVSGLFLALAAGLKLFPLALLPLFIFKKNWQAASLALLFLVLFTILPGMDLVHTYYVDSAPKLAANIGYSNFYDQSLIVFLMRLTRDITFARIVGSILLVVLYMTACTFYLRRQNEQNFKLAAYYILAWLAIANTFSWQHHFVYSFPLIILIYKRIEERSRNNARLFISLALLVLIVHFPNEHADLLNNPFIISYQTIFLIVILSYSLTFFSDK